MICEPLKLRVIDVVILQLACDTTSTVSIESHTGMDRITASKRLTELSKRGLVEIVKGHQRGARRSYKITEQGLSALDDIHLMLK